MGPFLQNITLVEAYDLGAKQERERIIRLLDTSQTFYMADRFGVYAEPRIREALKPE